MRQQTLANRRKKLESIVTGLPEVVMSGGQHLKFTVRKKTFAYFLDDHHGDGIVSICCKAGPGVQQDLIELDPDRYYVPAYLGARGWVGLRLDRAKIEWAEVTSLVEGSYRLTAPKRLAEAI